MILKLALGHRYELALQYTSAKESNRYGLQYLYTLAAPVGHVLYVPPVAHADIQSLHLEPGEMFSLTKSIGEGNAHVWDVERIQLETPAEPPTPKPIASARTIVTAPKPAGIVEPPTLTTEESRRIFRQLVATIQACQAAEAFGTSIGYSVKFGPDDLRAMAISGFIEQSRRAA